jgi:hypothetical protein
MRSSVVLALLALGLLAPGAAAAAGFPVAALDTTRTGATAPGDPYRYVAFPGAGRTLIAKIDRAGGAPSRYVWLQGTHVVASVAQDASTTGLSADGSTLVLDTPRRRFPRHATRLLVLDTARLHLVRTLRLHGDFALDGVSPDGRRVYLIQYRSGDPRDYAVRAYDVAHHRLLRRPIVDARNPDEKMTGFPITRATSADGRWAYTLYAGGEEQFVHALDTARGRAFCVDLEGLTPDDVNTMHLAVRHGRIDLVDQSGEVVRRIDASTFRVSEPPAPVIADDPAGGGFPWGLAAVVAAVAACALFVLRRRYAAGTDSAASRSESSSSPTVP